MSSALRVCLTALMTVLVLGHAAAAPPLTETQRQNLRDYATDHDEHIDGSVALYVLLKNANADDWLPDDFAGEGGAATAPAPDYGVLRDRPAEARGNVFLIEGTFEQQVRFPVGERPLQRAGNPDWGDRVTRWAIRTDQDDEESTVIVMFNDPEAGIKPPQVGTKVRVAARFYKVWATTDDSGEPFAFPVFVGGAREVVATSPRLSVGGGKPVQGIVIALIIACIAGYFVSRHLMNRKAVTGAGGRTQAYLEQRRRDRDHDEQDAGEQDVPDPLPEDPAEAMEVLRQRHDEA
ncbi:MAG: hypothetical protein AAGC44_10855 [Planctomycetota bacterium]